MSTTEGKVIEMVAHRPSYPPPAHFKKQARAVWEDLVASTPSSLHVPENRFTFEFAATLLSRFRSGRTMTVAELKGLRGYMAALGLALPDDAQARPANPRGPLSKYRR